MKRVLTKPDFRSIPVSASRSLSLGQSSYKKSFSGVHSYLGKISMYQCKSITLEAQSVSHSAQRPDSRSAGRWRMNAPSSSTF